MTVSESRAAQRDPAGVPVTTPVAGISIPADSTAPAFTSGPGARARILATAMRLFYYEGIRSVGIDRLIAESSVTKATFYKHFGSKDALILTYIQSVHEETVAAVNAIEAEISDPAEVLRSLVAGIQRDTQRDDFRGCPFANAASEYPDRTHEVRKVVTAHRDWYAAFIAEQFRLAGHSLPGDAADEFILLRDGAMVGGYVGDPIATAAALSRLSDHCLIGI
ncbi:TetR/AcrR family transcriptional regulator [Salinibacterium sp. SYSU T00001]|uniref:TetR/AcrR family transcriptional regulator n=1 Tax=Homoserinimonas sedimenticola TaxID=2986805 RepID=UPI002236B4B0|nr:TetR/AcrR family transcriptional regulator [Salinibacterium sedimenticola]MCW4386751.1 TetR/AcrR family transcriptional regulator [Salinibacterium sedimenticola]